MFQNWVSLESGSSWLSFAQAREQEGADYESRLDTSRHEYEALEQQLTSEIKLLREFQNWTHHRHFV